MELFEAIHTRRSVRTFTGEALPKEVLLKLVRAGMAAPSAKNVQPWNFIIVTEKPTLLEMHGYLPNASMLNKAGAAIVVCGLPDKDDVYAQKHWPVDYAAATENILLAAHALGYGAVWTAVYPNEDRAAPVKKTLHIPHNVEPLCIIPIGIPAGNPTPKDKFDEKNIRWEQWL